MAELYLRKHRGIQGQLPGSLRFHPGLNNEGKFWPALVAIGQNEQNQFRALQVIYLDPKTGNKAPVDVAKKTFGVLGHDTFGVLLNKGSDNSKIAVAEGIETGLSIKEARPELTIYAGLGINQLGKVPLVPETKEVLICADNDGDKAGSQRILKQAIHALSHRGLTVKIAIPPLAKSDFNDVLKREGIQAVRKLLTQEKRVAFPQSPEHQLQELDRLAEKLKSQLSSSKNFDVPHDELKTTELASKYSSKESMIICSKFSKLKSNSEKMYIDKIKEMQSEIEKNGINSKVEKYQAISQSMKQRDQQELKKLDLVNLSKQLEVQKHLNKEHE